MREMMQKAINALNERKTERLIEKHRQTKNAQSQSSQPEDWGMSPEEALKASMVSSYK